jgi:hypothetical protein
MGSWVRNSWSWNLTWQSELSSEEEDAAVDLLAILEQARPKREEVDRYRWAAHAAGIFTVKSAYLALTSSRNSPLIGPHPVQVFKELWLNNVPSKVSIFGWRLLLEKLPTKDVLYNKGIITNTLERCCVFCLNELEDINHIFFTCTVSSQIWSKVFRWMGINPIGYVNINNHFTRFGGLLKGGHYKKFRHLIWLATTWSIWRKRNNIVFRGDDVNIVSLVDQIIYIAWF